MDAGGDTNQTAIMDGGSTAGLPSSRHICGLPARRLSAFASTTAEGWRSRERRAAKYGWTRSCGPSPLAPARLALRVAGVPWARLRRHLVCNLSCLLGDIVLAFRDASVGLD